MELLKVELYNKGIKIDIEEDFIEISVENAKAATKMLSCDEIFDAIADVGSITHKSIKERVIGDYPEQFENILHEFFNHKSDANKYLTAEQQEDLEADFYDFINSYNNLKTFKI